MQETWTTIARGPDTLDECRGGSRGVNCGYNAGWTDPGDWVMRVNGQGRTSLITYPGNGRIPARVSGPDADIGEFAQLDAHHTHGVQGCSGDCYAVDFLRVAAMRGFK